MWARLSIVAGLVVGIATAGLLLGGLFAFAPETPLPSVALPSAPVASVAPSTGPSPLASASAEASVAPSSAAFFDGQSVPPPVVPQLAGDRIDPCRSCQHVFR